MDGGSGAGGSHIFRSNEYERNAVKASRIERPSTGGKEEECWPDVEGEGLDRGPFR